MRTGRATARANADSESAIVRWANSGLALLTGGAAPVLPERDFAGRLEVMLAAARDADAGPRVDMRLFTERAAELGLTRRGQTSANGTARLIETADGWLAVNLARPDDIEALPAWIGGGVDKDPWVALGDAARRRTAADLAEAGQELGIPAAIVASPDDARRRARAAAGPRIVRLAEGRGEPVRDPLVLDLSSLWAGPLCAHLLGLAGARVVKVESLARPDAARGGPPGFFDRLHAGHESVVLDFATREGRAQLSRLIERADLVIESSRPRALEQLGVELEAMFAANQAMVWVSLTAYGRTGPWSNRVGFGDDAAAAGGLVVRDRAERPMFAGDALADPVAGLAAATSALKALAAGGGVLVDTALRDAAALVAAADPVDAAERDQVIGEDGHWRLARAGVSLLPPRARPRTVSAAPRGADTAAILAEFG